MVRVHDLRLLPLLAAVWGGALLFSALGVSGSAVGLVIALIGAGYAQIRGWTLWRAVALGIALVAPSVGVQTWIFLKTWDEATDEPIQVWAVAVTDSREIRAVRGPPLFVTSVRIQARGHAAAPELLRSRGVVIGEHPHIAGQQLRILGRVREADPSRELAVVIRARSTVVEQQPGGLLALPTHLRSELREEVASRHTAGAGLFMAITLGDESELDAELDESLRTVSLTHITAVSGAHFAIILGAALAVVSWLPGGSWRAGLLLIALPGALIPLVHPSPSVLRASIVAVVMGVAILLGRRSQALTALAAAALLLLCVDPWMATNYGFVLSVVATGGIVLLCDPVATALGKYIPDFLAKTISVPLCAQAACAPVLILLAPQQSPYAVLANVLAAAALVPITLCGLLACLLLPLLPALGKMLITVGSWCSELVVLVANWTAGLPGAALPWPAGIVGMVLAAALSTAVVSAVLLFGAASNVGSRPQLKNMAGS